jgi:hypothetical protein
MHIMSTNGSKEEHAFVYGRAKLVLFDNLVTGTATPGSNCVENFFGINLQVSNDRALYDCSSCICKFGHT